MGLPSSGSSYSLPSASIRRTGPVTLYGPSCRTLISTSAIASSWAHLAIGALTDLRVHVHLHHLQCRACQPLVDVGHRVTRHGHAQLPHVRVEGAVEDALLGDLASQHEMANPVLAEEILERRAVEDRVTGLDDERHLLTGREDGLHQVRPLAVHGAIGDLLRRGMPVAVVVVYVDHLHALLRGPLDEAVHGRHGLLHAGGELVGVGVVVGIEHVHHHERAALVAHDSSSSICAGRSRLAASSSGCEDQATWISVPCAFEGRRNASFQWGSSRSTSTPSSPRLSSSTIAAATSSALNVMWWSPSPRRSRKRERNPSPRGSSSSTLPPFG